MSRSLRYIALALAACAFSLAVPVARAEDASSAAPASTGDVARGRKIAERVQRYYGKRKDFQASFAQKYTYAALGRVEEKKGTVQVKRPGLLRWEYAGPDKKLLVLDGKAFWQWSPEDNQVAVKRDVKSVELSSAFTFLWGKGDLLAEFTPQAVALPDGLPRGDAVQLLPKKAGGSVQKIIFSVDTSGRVLASIVTDAQGNENQMIFSDAKIDQKIPDSVFQFTPSLGANVQELP